MLLKKCRQIAADYIHGVLMTTNTASETLTEVRRSLKPPNGALSNDEQPKPLSDNDIATRASCGKAAAVP
jgi:hypothetical protein